MISTFPESTILSKYACGIGKSELSMAILNLFLRSMHDSDKKVLGLLRV